MIELKILTNNADELRIMGIALLELAKITDGEEVVIPDHAVSDKEIPSILKKQNPIEESAVKQGTGIDPETPDLDADGYPWDKRIHSTAHSTNSNGTWKVLRRPKIFGEDDEKWKAFIERTRAELRGEDPDATQEDPATVFGGDATGGTKTTETGTQSEDPAAGMTQEAEPEAKAEDLGECPADFAGLMKFITTNKLPIDKVTAICASMGMNTLMDLQKNVNYIPMVYAGLVELANGTQQ